MICVVSGVKSVSSLPMATYVKESIHLIAHVKAFTSNVLHFIVDIYCRSPRIRAISLHPATAQRCRLIV